MHSEVGQRSLEDVCGIVGKQIRALGHEAWLDPRNAKAETAVFAMGPDRINVLVEGFTPQWIEVFTRARKAGARFLVLATEEPTPKGFNWGTQKEMVRRQELFPAVKDFADGILHLVPGKHVTDWYGQWAPAAQAELGYADGLFRPTNQVPEYEFGFYGSLTPRREKILKKLAKMTNAEKAVKIVHDFKTQVDRDREMRRAKVILQIRKFDAMGLVSSSRCNTAIMIGRPVVAEPHDLTKPWDSVIDFPSSMENFYASAMFAKATWLSLWKMQLERFKTVMTPDFCVGDPLRQIGILGSQRAAA
jgi:hypothetical protein